MKRLKLSFLLILIGSALLLSAVGESAESLNPKEAKPQNKEPQLHQKEPAQQQAPTDQLLTGDEFLHSPPDHPTANGQTAEQESETGPPTNSTWWFNLFIAIFTGCLVCVGIAQIVVYKKQARYMRRGLKLTRQAANAAEESAKAVEAQLHVYRPFLIVTAMKMECPYDPQRSPFPIRPFVANVTIKNFGIGPADIINFNAYADIFPKPLPDPQISDARYWEKDSNRLGEPVIGAGESVARINVVVSLDEKDIAAMFSYEKWLAIHGKIRYRGGPKKVSYSTRFFWWYSGPGDNPEGWQFIRPADLDGTLNSQT